MKRALLCGSPALRLAAAATAPDACAPCHRAETERLRASLAHDARAESAARTAPSCGRIPNSPRRSAPIPTRSPAQIAPLSADGKQTLRVPAGVGLRAGRRPGRPYSSAATDAGTRAASATSPHCADLDLTMGAQNVTPRNLAEAAGRLAARAEMRHDASTATPPASSNRRPFDSGRAWWKACSASAATARRRRTCAG